MPELASSVPPAVAAARAGAPVTLKTSRFKVPGEGNSAGSRRVIINV